MFAVARLAFAPKVPGKVPADARNNFLPSAAAVEGEGAAGGGERKEHGHL